MVEAGVKPSGSGVERMSDMTSNFNDYALVVKIRAKPVTNTRPFPEGVLKAKPSYRLSCRRLPAALPSGQLRLSCTA